MGTIILRGISSGLFVTVLTLLAGIIWTAMGFSGLGISTLRDIGLIISCLVGGFKAGKESRNWVTGGLVGLGYVTVGIILLALFFPLSKLGIVQVLAEGGLIGLIAGALGAGGAGAPSRGYLRPYRQSYNTNSSWQDTTDINREYSVYEDSLVRKAPYDTESYLGKTTYNNEVNNDKEYWEDFDTKKYIDENEKGFNKPSKSSLRPWWEEDIS